MRERGLRRHSRPGDGALGRVRPCARPSIPPAPAGARADFRPRTARSVPWILLQIGVQVPLGCRDRPQVVPRGRERPLPQAPQRHDASSRRDHPRSHCRKPEDGTRLRLRRSGNSTRALLRTDQVKPITDRPLQPVWGAVRRRGPGGWSIPNRYGQVQIWFVGSHCNEPVARPQEFC